MRDLHTSHNMIRRPPLSRVFTFFLSLIPGFWALYLPPVMAAYMDAEFTATTRILLKEDAMGHDYAATYEYTDFELRNILNRDLSFHFSGWYRHHLSEIPEDRDESGRDEQEITLAYLHTPFRNGRIQGNLGRLFLSEPLIQDYLDGLTVRWDITGASGFSAYAGRPVPDDEGRRSSDSLAGGRFYQRLRTRAEIGLSYAMAGESFSTSHEELGADVWFQPVSLFEIQGRSACNLKTDDWIDHSYCFRIFPTKRATVTTVYARTDYRGLPFSDGLSLIWPDLLEEGGEVERIDNSLEYTLNEGMNFVVDYNLYRCHTSGRGRMYGLHLTADLPAGIHGGASCHRMDGPTEDLRYLKSRLYAVKGFKGATVSLDGMHLHYDQALSGRKDAYSLNGTVTYAFGHLLTATCDLEFLRDQEFHDSLSSFLTIGYHFD